MNDSVASDRDLRDKSTAGFFIQRSSAQAVVFTSSVVFLWEPWACRKIKVFSSAE